LVDELAADGEARRRFLANGNFVATRETLVKLWADPAHYEQVLPGLHWSPPRR
jgi:hypothetical protein